VVTHVTDSESSNELEGNIKISCFKNLNQNVNRFFSPAKNYIRKKIDFVKSLHTIWFDTPLPIFISFIAFLKRG